MRFGEKIHTLRTLGWRLGVSPASVGKVENDKPAFGDYSSEDLIRRLDAPEAGEEELPIVARKIPEPIRRRFFERPDAFRQIARRLDRLLTHLNDDR